MYNGNVQQNPYVQHPVTKNLHISPRFSPTIFYRDANSVLLLAITPFSQQIGSMRRTLCSKLLMMSVNKVNLHMYNGNIQQNLLDYA